MVNQNSLFGGMLTTQGAAKKTNCDTLGIPWEPRYMLIGDANGADPVPSPTQTKLVNQVYRAQLNQLRVSPTDDNILIAELVLPPDVGGWWIRELALEDKDGVFCAVANAAPSYKPLLAQGSGRNQVVRMHIITSGNANIQLKIDPSVVLATRQYVGDAVNGLLPANKTAGTFTKVTVDDRGVFLSGSNPTSLAGYGITNAFSKTETTNLIAASMAAPVVTVSAAKTLTVDDMGLVLINASAAAFAVELPDANAALGVRDVIVRRNDNTGNRLVIKAAGDNKIKFHTHLRAEGYPFLVLMGAGDFWRLRSDGAGSWWPVGRFDSTPLGRPIFETTMVFQPGGNGPLGGVLYNRAEWPWLWDHAQASGMLTTEALRVGMEGCWTSGDGVQTFRGPDVRGEFLRVLDEKRGVEKDVIYGNLTVGSPTVTAVSFIGSTFGVGATISGTGIPVGTTVLSVNVAAGTITMSANATAAGSTSIAVVGRQAGSSQAGTPNNIDTGASNAVLSGKVSGVSDPGVARVGFAMDEGDIAKYHANAGQFAIGATNSGAFSMGTEVSWGLVRPRNIAYPGRIKLI